MRLLSFILGILIILACVAAPLPVLDSVDPFSAHMVRHTSLLLLAAPLLALAMAPDNIAKNRLTALSRFTARYPFLAWITGIAIMWCWHIPSVYNTMHMMPMDPIALHPMSHPAMPIAASILHDSSLLAAGLVFCWPVITPYTEFRLKPLSAVLYLASACVGCSLLGLLITFAPAGTYRDITPGDQQIGGLIMWVPCCVLYLSASMYILIHWLSLKGEITLIHPQNS